MDSMEFFKLRMVTKKRVKKEKNGKYILAVFFLLFIVNIGFAKWLFEKLSDTTQKEDNIYQELLTEYERVMTDSTYTEEQWGNNIYDYVKTYIGETELYYCIKDLAGDGVPELIIGTMQDGVYEICGITYEKGYVPFIIYSYDSGQIEWSCISENYIMRIYENGIVEYISGGTCSYYMYEQIKNGNPHPKKLRIIAQNVIGDNKSAFYIVENESYQEISEIEFLDIKRRYTGKREDLEWKPLEGFFP